MVCGPFSVPQSPLSAMGVVSLTQGCWEVGKWGSSSRWLLGRDRGPQQQLSSQQRAPGAGGRDAAVMLSLAGSSQAGGSRGPGCPRQVAGSRAGDPVPSPGQGEECPAAEVGHLNCRCGRPWSGTSSGRSGPCAGALAKVVAVWQHFSCPCLPPFSPPL